MEKKKKLTIQDWKEIANKAKQIDKSYLNMIEILNVLPSNLYVAKLKSAYTAANKLTGHLDNMYEFEFGNSPDYMPFLFLGEPE